MVVSGAVEPDTYQLAVPGPRLTSLRIGHKAHEIVRGSDGADRTLQLDADRADARVLSDAEAADVARLAMGVQEHFGVPQDVEWVIADGVLRLVQARPITTLGGPPEKGGAAPLLRGPAAAPGRATGRVRILTSPAEGAALQPGEVLVAPMTNPDWLPTIRRAVGLVTDGGGTCHAGSVRRGDP